MIKEGIQLMQNVSTRKYKIAVIIIYVVFALPILPFFVASVFSLISFPMAATDIGNASNTGQYLGTLCFLITMVLTAVYIITYIISLVITIVRKKISILSFLPLFHIVLIVLFYLATEWLQGTYGTPPH